MDRPWCDKPGLFSTTYVKAQSELMTLQQQHYCLARVEEVGHRSKAIRGGSECVRVCADVPACAQPEASMETTATVLNLPLLCCDATLLRLYGALKLPCAMSSQN
eukprot:7533-Heterococcus_DN1.PRE.1